MKAKFGREIALLTLPVLLIGGVALWNGKIKSWSGWGAPLGLYEGKPRLEIAKWEKETPSALDFARGISSRWKVTTWHGGVCPADGNPPQYGGMEYPKNLYFAWKRAGKWHRTPFRYGPSELDVMNFAVREKPTSHRVQLGLPMDIVPRDAEEVRLRGYMEGWMMCRSGTVRLLSAPLDVSLKAPGEKQAEFVGSRVSPLKFVGVKQNWYSQKANVVATNSFWQVASGFSYTGQSEKSLNSVAHTWIEDAEGHWVLDIGTTSWGPYPNSNGPRSSSRVVSNPIWKVDIRRLNLQNGPFTLKSWVYVDENEWPLRISIPLNIAKPPKPIR